MPFFQYRARDRQGALVTGTLEADDKSGLEVSLDRMGLIPISVESVRKSSAPLLKGVFGQGRVSTQEVILFSRQLATLFGAGVPLTRALISIERQMTNMFFASVVREIREHIEGGGVLSAAIKKYPRVFPELYSSMVEAGEAGGILDDILERLAFMLEKSSENRSKVKSATLYPKIVIFALFAAVIVLMYFVVPRFATLYASFKTALPLPTRMLIAASNFFTAYWYLIALSVASVIIGYKVYTSTESGRLNWDRLALKVPIFGPIIKKSILSRFSRLLGALYKSGLPILQSLDIVSRAVENRLIANEIIFIETEVRAGKPLSELMASSRHFPPLVVQMVSIGEETGNLDTMLEKAAQYYDQEVDSAIRNLTTALEPILLSFLFGMVLFLALAIFLPMWDMVKLVRG